MKIINHFISRDFIEEIIKENNTLLYENNWKTSVGWQLLSFIPWQNDKESDDGMRFEARLYLNEILEDLDIPSSLSIMTTEEKVPRRFMFAHEFLKYVTLN